MHTPFSLIKRAAMFSCVILLALSVYSTTAVPVPTQTYRLSGIVFAEKCPINPAMGMPCTLSPVPGCTVTVSYETVLGPGDVVSMLNPAPTSKSAIVKTLTGTNGAFSITVIALTKSTALLSAAKAGEGASAPINVSLTKNSATVNLILQNAVSTPPPIQGSEILQGTVFVTLCPPATSPPMEMPCPLNSLPQCTVAVVPMAVPMLYPTPPEYQPHTTVTDVNGRYSLSLPAGDYIVTAQKSGLGSAQEQITLQANRTITLDLTLAAKDTVPISPIGKATVQGTVKEIINPPNPYLGMASVVQPVPGCTVLVCAAVLPGIYNQSGQGVSAPGAANSRGSTAIVSTSNVPAVLIAQQYITLTDSDGNYSFKDLPIYGETYSVVLMAKKGQKFGVTQTNLIDGQTVNADIIIGEVVSAVVTDTSIVLPDIYRNYYEAVVKTLSLQNPAAIKMHSFVSNVAAAGSHFSGSFLIINLPRDQRLTIKAFTVNGKEVATFADNRFFGAGKLNLRVAAKYCGPMFITVRGENISYIVQVNSLRHR